MPLGPPGQLFPKQPVEKSILWKTVQDGSPQRPPSVQQGEKDNPRETSQAQKQGESVGKATALAG